MRRLITAMTLATALPLLAQDTAPRIVFFNLSQLVDTSAKAKKIYVDLEVTGKRLQAALEQKGSEAQKIQAQLQSSAISDQGKEQLQKQLRDLDFEYKKLQTDSQEEIKKVQQKVMGELNQVVLPIVDAVAKEQKVQIVLNGDQASQMVVWADTDWVKAFTAEVAKRLDATPDGAAAPKAATTPKPAAAPAKPANKPK